MAEGLMAVEMLQTNVSLPCGLSVGNPIPRQCACPLAPQLYLGWQLKVGLKTGLLISRVQLSDLGICCSDLIPVHVAFIQF